MCDNALLLFVCNPHEKEVERRIEKSKGTTGVILGSPHIFAHVGGYEGLSADKQTVKIGMFWNKTSQSCHVWDEQNPKMAFQNNG